MQIRVKSLQGDEYIVSTRSDQLVSQLKANISEKADGLPVDRLKLIYKGRTMHDSTVVGEYNLENDCKVHLIIKKESTPVNNNKQLSPMDGSTTKYHASSMQTERSLSLSSSSSSSSTSPSSSEQPQGSKPNSSDDNKSQRQNRYEQILRERLGQHFSPQTVEQIMDNLQKEINADMSSSSLDDLEQMAKQKLNISND